MPRIWHISWVLDKWRNKLTMPFQQVEVDPILMCGRYAVRRAGVVNLLFVE
jgi:hypothetical protein